MLWQSIVDFEAGPESLMKRKTPPTKTYKREAKRQKKTVPLTRMVNTVRGGPELKNFDTQQTLSVPLAGTFVRSTLLNAVPQGLTANTRIGRKMRMTQLVLRWEYVMNAGIGGGPCRIKIFYDKQASGSTPTATDVLEIDNFLGQNNLAQADRFVTLLDMITPPLSTANNLAVGGVEKRSFDLEQLWSGAATGTAADVITGSIWLMAWNTGTNATAAPILNCTTRIRYLDN